MVVATKFSCAMGRDPNRHGTSRRWIMRAVEDPLRRLQTDHIDVYQIHRLDLDTDIEETLSALTDLVRAGKVRERIDEIVAPGTDAGTLDRQAWMPPQSRRSSCAADRSISAPPPERASPLEAREHHVSTISCKRGDRRRHRLAMVTASPR